MNPITRAARWGFDKPYLLLILTTLFWGGNAVAGKLAVGEISPMALTTLRWILSALLLWAVARRQIVRDLPVIRQSWCVLVLLGCLGFAGFVLILYTALHHTSAVNVSIEQASIPIMIIVMNFVLFRAPVGPLTLIGVTITCIGVALTATNGDLAALRDFSVNFGDALMLVGCLVYAAYSVGLRNRPPIHWLSFVAVLSTVAAVVCLPFFVWELAAGRFVFTAWAPAFLFYVVLFPSILAQLFFVRAVELIGSNRAGVFTNFVPVFGALLAVIIVGEAFRLHHLIAFACVFAGVALAERYRDRPWRRARGTPV